MSKYIPRKARLGLQAARQGYIDSNRITERITVGLTREQREAIEIRAKMRGTTPSVYVRCIALKFLADILRGNIDDDWIP